MFWRKKRRALGVTDVCTPLESPAPNHSEFFSILDRFFGFSAIFRCKRDLRDLYWHLTVRDTFLLTREVDFILFICVHFNFEMKPKLNIC